MATESLRRVFPAAPNAIAAGSGVSSEHRLRRLRELLARIEQLPASSETERMLREIRARVVDVDTGETPRAMLPVDPVPLLATDPEPSAASVPNTVRSTRADHDRGRADGPPPQRTKPVRAAGSRSVGRATAAGLTAAQDREWLSLVATNEVLSLDDAAQLQPPGEPRAGQDRRPWTRGLRG